MPNQTIVNRLVEAGSPNDRSQWEKDDGYYVSTCRISSADVPDLIEIVKKWHDASWPEEDLVSPSTPDAELLPVTAWRALADLKAAESVEPLFELLDEAEFEGLDDWLTDELPHVFGKIGAPAIASLIQRAVDTERSEDIRSTAIAGLHRAAELNADCRDEVVACFIDLMTNSHLNCVPVNSAVLVGLEQLRVVEAAEQIERAFANNHLDVGLIGDWEAVRTTFGVQGLGLEMPKHPYNSMVTFRHRMGIGIFSSERIYYDGEAREDAVVAYLNQAAVAFGESKECEQVRARYEGCLWSQNLLECGLNEFDEIVDEMTVLSVEGYLGHYIPAKVCVEADRAAEIVFELTMFWQFIDRVYDLPYASPIVEWLSEEGTVDWLEAQLSDPSNYGMAKSMQLAGTAAGYDMTTEQGMHEFMNAYNRTVQRRESPHVQSHSTPIISQPKVGRNDPCPCGSGKKFKKCCR